MYLRLSTPRIVVAFVVGSHKSCEKLIIVVVSSALDGKVICEYIVVILNKMWCGSTSGRLNI